MMLQHGNATQALGAPPALMTLPSSLGLHPPAYSPGPHVSPSSSDTTAGLPHEHFAMSFHSSFLKRVVCAFCGGKESTLVSVCL